MIESYLQTNLRSKKYKLIWIESICNIPSIIEKNIYKTKLNSPDYQNWSDDEKAAEDFRNRIREYEKIYEKVSIESDGESAAFIQIINQGEKMIIRNVKGYIESKIISYLTNLHTGERPIFFLRHGESEANKLGVIGGDASLSPLGVKYSELVAKFFESQLNYYTSFYQKPQIFTSTLRRSMETADKLAFLNSYKAEKSLDELNAGLRDGFSYDDLKVKFPKEDNERSLDKLNYRYPRGESYMDVIQRIEPIIFEIERIREPVIIVGHQGMLRCLYGYFAGVPIDMIPTLEIPMHTIIKFVPDAYGFYEVRYYVDAETGIITEDDKNFVKFYDNLLHCPD